MLANRSKQESEDTPIIQQDETAWREGWKAGATGKPPANPYPTDDPRGLAWISGFIEGKANPDTVPQMRPIRPEP